MRFSLVSFVVAAATLALAQPSVHRRGLTFNPTKNDFQPVDPTTAPAPDAPTTNGQRLARGLPLLPPKTHRRGAPHRLGSRVQSAPRAVSSPAPPVSAKCNIRVTGTDGTDFGFLSPLFNSFGEYGQFQSTQDGALVLSMSYSPDSPSQIGATAINGPNAAYPWFGGIDGFASDSNDFGPGSFNYAYIGGTTQTPPGSPPDADGDSTFSHAIGIPEAVQSAIWTYDPATQAVKAQWINTDGSAPTTHLLYANDGNEALAMTGDIEALNSYLGTSYPEVMFSCVTPSVTPARI